LNILIKTVLQSFLIVLLIACTAGLAAGFISKSISTGIGVGIIVVIEEFIRASFITSKRRTEQFLQFQRDVFKNAAEIKVPYDVSCAYCNMANSVPLSLITENTFVCKSCNQANKIIFQLTVVRITKPLNVPDSNLSPVELDADDVVQSTINESIKIKHE